MTDDHEHAAAIAKCGVDGMVDLFERIEQLEAENAHIQKERHMLWRENRALKSQINVEKATVETMRADKAELVEGMSRLERYDAMNCFDRWLKDGHEKSPAYDSLLEETRALCQANTETDRQEEG